MIFPTEFRTDLMSRPADAETLEGLKLVEDRINDVIRAINTELDQFDPDTFRKDGEIRPTSFGDTDRAPLLALHHRRAHAVTAETLIGVRKDLVAFRQACRDASTFVEEADENAAVEVALTQRAVDRLNEGSTSAHGDTANQRAQQSGSGGEPAGAPTGGPETDTPSGGPIVDGGTDGATA